MDPRSSIDADFDRDVWALLGLPVDATDMDGTVARVDRSISDEMSGFISTPNLNFLMSSLDDAVFRDSVIHSDWVIADGMPLIWMAGMLDLPFDDRIAGSDLVEVLRARTDGYQPVKVFLFGAPPGVADAAREVLNAEAGGIICVGAMDPGWGSVEDMSTEETIARINATDPDFVIASLGARKGQEWIERNRARLNAPVISHLGAVTNFIAGRIDRAPRWMQKAGLEWAWRIVQEPKLVTRYLKDGTRFLRVLATRVVPYRRLLRARGDGVASGEVSTDRDEQRVVVTLAGTWDHTNVDQLRGPFRAAAGSELPVEVDLGAVSYVDAAVLGLMLVLRKHQDLNGQPLRVLNPSADVRRILRYSELEYLL